MAPEAKPSMTPEQEARWRELIAVGRVMQMGQAHGTVESYHKGCQCDPCSAAYRESLAMNGRGTASVRERLDAGYPNQIGTQPH